VVTRTVGRAVTLPYEAIGQDENNREYLYVIQEGRAVKRLIVTGRELSDCVEILAGATDGEPVILNPDDVRHGQRVQVAA
jgi:hypothetical protein